MSEQKTSHKTQGVNERTKDVTQNTTIKTRVAYTSSGKSGIGTRNLEADKIRSKAESTKMCKRKTVTKIRRSS